MSNSKSEYTCKKCKWFMSNDNDKSKGYCMRWQSSPVGIRLNDNNHIVASLCNEYYEVELEILS